MVTRSELRRIIQESLIRMLSEDEEKQDTPDEGEDTNSERQIGQPLPSTNTPKSPDGEDAADTAHKMGLQYAGWSKWKDPKSGKVVAKTVDGKLVKLDKPEEPDDDAYSSPVSLGGDKAGRTQRLGLGKVTGNPQDTKNAISRGAALPKDAKDAASTGGFGTFKGSELGSHHVQPPLTPEGDPIEVSFKGQDGIIDTIDQEKGQAHITLNSGEGMWVGTDQLKKRGAAPTNPEASNKGEKLAADMEKKYGGVDKALVRLRDNIQRLEKQHKFRKNHNTNDTASRLDSLQDWEGTLEKLYQAEKILLAKKKQSVKEAYSKLELD